MLNQRVIRTLPLALLLLCVAWQGVALAAPPENSESESLSTEKLIEQLGAKSFFAREKAMAALISAGPGVEEQVRVALDDRLLLSRR